MDCYKPKTKIKKKEVYYDPRHKFAGEIIIQRREDINFTEELDHLSQKLISKIPSFSYEKRINHYNKKVRHVFKEEFKCQKI